KPATLVPLANEPAQVSPSSAVPRVHAPAPFRPFPGFDLTAVMVMKGYKTRKVAFSAESSLLTLSFVPKSHTLSLFVGHNHNLLIGSWAPSTNRQNEVYLADGFGGDDNKSYDIAFSPDGRTLATGKHGLSDERAQLWSVADGSCVGRLAGRGRGVAF